MCVYLLGRGDFFHLTYTHLCCGAPGLYCPGRPGVEAAAWLSVPDVYGGVWWQCWSGGPCEGRNWLLGRLVVAGKHAYWQFLPDELISPFILPELPDNLPSVKFRQKGPLPCPDLAGSACQPTAPGRPEGLAFGSGASPSASMAPAPLHRVWGRISHRSLPFSGRV